MKALLGLAAVAISSNLMAGTIISTGVAAWQVNSAAAVVETTIPVGIWIGASNACSLGAGFGIGTGCWVGTSATDGAFSTGTDGQVPGTYTFTLAIGALIGGSGTVSFEWAADNGVVWSMSTGETVTVSSACPTGTGGDDCFQAIGGAPRTATASFGATSVLTAVVTNAGAARSPMGLLVSGSADPTGPVPEPSTYAMLALGGAAFAAARLRRK